LKKRRFYSFFAIVVGILMLLMWSFFLFAGMVPELDSRPAEIILHLCAEFSTALALIVAGFLAFKSSGHRKWLYPLSIGMLLYTLIVSPGYYIQSGDYLFVVMFGSLIVLSIVSLILFIGDTHEG